MYINGTASFFLKMVGGMEDEELAIRQRELAEWWEREQMERENGMDVDAEKKKI
ncbi:MAG: hypothetical protein ACKPKO_57535 [Candidatus Fonsibacter sp.]